MVRLKLGRRTLMLGTVSAVLIGLIAVGVVGALGIVGWEYSNSNQFCATMCHGVHPEESRNHLVSAHARVNCVECHMGRTSTLHLMALKPTHAKELWGMIAGYERPLHASTLRPAREACESCHYPLAEHHDSIVVNKRFAADAQSSQIDYRLVLHTTANVDRETPWKVTGIHWHVGNVVEFVTPDAQRREIPWVRITRPDGTKITYTDSTSKMSRQELEKLEPRRMECFDCHNQVGHPFRNPADVVDEAIASGRIDKSLPSVKARAMGIIDAVGDLTGSPEANAAQIDKAVAASAAKFEVKPADQPKEQAFLKEMKQILLATSIKGHEGKAFTWKSFPNHAGHKDAPGCFRCHDGKHFNDKGEAIRLQCTLCHNLPQVTMENGKGSVPSTVAAGLTPPPSHNEPNFMHDHRMKMDESCQMCHGKLEFGREGGNFCSNPACHGRAWPEVNLNAAPAAASATPAPAPPPATKAGAKAKG
ncbi:MAG TPA: NapC/NirT family cytochrome c [Casimicrobiaceae bacterium]|nr:NapC/NirT family cytochrome c [Casimicrobiaceae bacterium]